MGTRIEKLRNALAKAEAADKARQDKLRTRRMIILGTAIEAAMAKGEVSISGVVFPAPQAWLSTALKRAQDRAAWGLPPAVQEAASGSPP